MPVIGINGVLVLIPAAVFLGFNARAAEFDARFYAAQYMALLAGPTILHLLGWCANSCVLFRGP